MAKVIIVGAGVSGLSAGIYARKCGFEVEVYEMHNIPGGECTGWNRKGYHFDNCIHWLTGTKKGTDLYKIWETVGALENIEIYTADEFMTVEAEGIQVHIYKDIEKLRSHFKEISPEDSAMIDDYCDAINCLKDFQIPSKKPMDMMNLKDFMAMMKVMKPMGKTLMRFGKTYQAEYVSKFKSKALRKAISSFVPEDFSMQAGIFTMATFASGNGGWPKGGSLAMSERMAAKLVSLGGKIHYKSRVNKIFIEDKKATGIVLEGGKIVKGDYIVPATDLHVTMNKLLEGRYKIKRIEKVYSDTINYKTQTSVSIGLGIACDLSNRPATYSVPIEPIACIDQIVDRIGLKHFCHEKAFAPEGKSVVTINLIESKYGWWDEKAKDKEAYKKVKDELGKHVVEAVEKVYPETTGKVEVVTIATPITYERYCGAYRGSWMAFATKPSQKAFSHNGILKEVKNMYIAGQWLFSPGGLPSALLTGKWAIQRLCKKEKIEFVD